MRKWKARTVIKISIQKLSIVVWYYFWIEKLYHMSIETFKLTKLTYIDQAYNINIQHSICCGNASLGKGHALSRTFIPSLSNVFIKLRPQWWTGCRTCDGSRCTIFACLQMVYKVSKGPPRVWKFCIVVWCNLWSQKLEPTFWNEKLTPQFWLPNHIMRLRKFLISTNRLMMIRSLRKT